MGKDWIQLAHDREGRDNTAMKGRVLAAWIATVSCSTRTLLHDAASNELVVY
jgi:hypothetical protein